MPSKVVFWIAGALYRSLSEIFYLDSIHSGQRDRLTDRISARRGMLISDLSFIFPIELISASDLLFGILDVALPIPLSASDPAPPSSLPSLPELTDDSVATALGHVAHAVQLIAAYIGQMLPYPITSAGSRSNIKDPISVMMGPRK